MKKMMLTFVLLFAFLIASFGAVSADPGGAPALHGVDGKSFGAAVSGLAQMYPGAVADHVSGSSNGGGMPAAHGVDGRTFGRIVSGLAQLYPGALASHVSGK